MSNPGIILLNWGREGAFEELKYGVKGIKLHCGIRKAPELTTKCSLTSAVGWSDGSKVRFDLKEKLGKAQGGFWSVLSLVRFLKHSEN